MMNTKILIVEDDADIREGVRILLESEGYTVAEADNGKSGLALLDDSYSLVILDVMMPGMSGLKTCEEIRKISVIPVLFLTAKSTESDKLIGLIAGGDDYLVKPFALDELLARIRVMIRRSSDSTDHTLKIADLTVDTRKMTVFRGDTEIILTGKEFAILEYMLRNKGIVLTREKIEQHIWNYDYEGGTNVVNVYIRYLRKKIDDGFEPKLIHTIRGAGYVLKE